jgi:molybdopterin biosynthesis enzyme
MSQDARSALQSWKIADANARVAESQLRQAWAQVEAHRIEVVPHELAKTAAELRAQANDQLKLTLRLLRPEHPSDSDKHGSRS